MNKKFLNSTFLIFAFLLITDFNCLWPAEGDTIWTRNYGSPNQDMGTGIAADTFGNIYLINIEFINDEPGFAYLRKLDTKGDILWTEKIAIRDINVGVGVSVYKDANVYVSGFSVPRKEFAPIMWLIKYDNNGILQWTSTHTYACSYWNTVDRDGNIYVAGVVPGAGPTGVEIVTDPAIWKYDSRGSLLMFTTYYSLGYVDGAHNIAVDTTGNMYVLGYSSGHPSMPATFSGIWIAKYSPKGTLLWEKRIKGEEISPNVKDCRAYGIAIDPMNNIYICGSVVKSDEKRDIYVTAFDSEGRSLQGWPIIITNPGVDDEACDIFVNENGVYFTGFETVAGQSQNIVIYKYSHNGIQHWKRTYNGKLNSTDGGWSITIDELGNILVCGFSTEAENQRWDTWVGKYEGLLYSIKGRVTDKHTGKGVEGVKITLKKVSPTQREKRETFTNAEGYYSFLALPIGTYIVTPTKTNWRFSPPSSTTVLTANIDNLNFTGIYIEEKIDIPIGIGDEPVKVDIPKPKEAKIIVEERPEKPVEDRGTINPDKGEEVGIVFRPAENPENYIGREFKIRIFNLTGELVEELPPKIPKTADDIWIKWLPKDLPSGTYIIHVEGPGVNDFKKIAILR